MQKTSKLKHFNLKKENLTVNDYMLRIKLLISKLKGVGCGIDEEENLMGVTSGLDENYDNVFSTLTKRIMYETVTRDDAKALLQSHECRSKRRETLFILPLSSINMIITNSAQGVPSNA